MSTTSSSSSPNGSPGSPNGGSGSPRSNGSRPPGAGPPFRYSTRFKIVAALILAVVAGLAVVAYGIASDGSDDPVASSSGGTSEFVEQLVPPNDSQVLQQGTVGIDLVTGWTGQLSIEGVAIPSSDLDSGESETGDGVTSGLERLTFTPGPGKVMETLPLGPACAQAIVWERAAGRENSQRTVSWCFEVV